MIEWVLIIGLYFSGGVVTIEMQSKEACAAAVTNLSSLPGEYRFPLCINKRTGEMIKYKK